MSKNYNSKGTILNKQFYYQELLIEKVLNKKHFTYDSIGNHQLSKNNVFYFFRNGYYGGFYYPNIFGYYLRIEDDFFKSWVNKDCKRISIKGRPGYMNKNCYEFYPNTLSSSFSYSICNYKNYVEIYINN